jgi:hypothetical protein
MVKNTLVNSKVINSTVGVLTRGLMEQNILDDGKMTKEMRLVNNFCKLVKYQI